MNAFRVIGAPTSVRPFGPADSLPVLGEPLADARRRELAAAGFVEEVERTTAGGRAAGADRPVLLVGANVFLNAACARALLAAAPRGGRLVLRAPGWAEVAGGAASRAIEVAVVPPSRAGAGSEGAVVPGTPSIAALPAVELDADERLFSLAEGPESLGVAAPRRVACDVRSWADLLWTNLFAMTARVRNLSPAAGAWAVARAAARSLSLNRWRIAGRLVERGRGVDVHPSAVVEASVLGEGVRIGPGAVVRGSVLGPGCEVEELALVVGASLGRRARVQRQGMVKFSVLFDEASIGGVVQLSVLGRGAAIRGGAYSLDRRLDDRPVRLRGAAGLVEAGRALGCALGDGAALGSGVWIAPGRDLPAGVRIARSRRDVLASIPEALGAGVYEVEAGAPTRIGV